ncbi:hypothetical protein EYZ01_15890 [Hafnia alvei]|uniref:T6SS effector BTH_I2691 family protein n=1 Tax=Hafnia alvei TaxID=569 RepID=UPI0010336615|nr:T6SS effector BTH_I2691 family protein [Hafnia alvei]KAA0260493.1 hypothetical protein ERL64_19735 [Hafnia alvei]TBL37729.1 hypothetical protein EYZ01_15890 [Hafnia alvei]
MSLSPCTMCHSSGPALLPVRYAVVPQTIEATLPAWAEAAFPSSPECHYALRALRQGFLYVFYANSGAPEDSWEAWSVTDDGGLWKQLGGAFGAKEKKQADCTNPTHQSTNVEFVVLRDSALRNDISVAFSPSPWSRETILKYHNNAGIRAKRMQVISAGQWLAAPNASGISVVSASALESVLDYTPLPMAKFKSLLPYNPVVARVSKTYPEAPYYSFDEKQIGPQGTLYPWSNARAGNSAKTLETMSMRGKSADGKPVSPLMIAMHDPIGIAHELASWGDDISGLHSMWIDELSIEFMTHSSLLGVKKQLDAKAAARAQQIEADGVNYSPLWYAMTSTYTKQSKSEFQTKYDELVKNNAKLSGDNIAKQWSKYDGMLNHAKRQAFLDCYDNFCQVVAQQQEQLAQLRVQWLKQPKFITCCQDFESTKVVDNLNYREAVDFAFASLNLTDVGTAYLDTLIDQYSTSDEGNIVWRSLLLNNPDVMDELQGMLKKMAEMKGKVLLPQDESTLVAALLPMAGKLVDAYDKANEILEKPTSATTRFSRAVLHCDRRLSTLGDRFFNYSRLGKVLDTGYELMSKAFFQVISGVVFDKAVTLSVSQLQDGDAFRVRVMSELSSSGSSNRKVNLNLYKKQFDEFLQSADGKNELKKMRIKTLTLLFNILELSNLYEKSQKSYKERVQITSAALGTISTVLDIITPVFNNGTRNATISNSIKILGNSAGMIASALNFSVDASDFFGELYGKKRWVFIGLNATRTISDFSLMLKSLGGLLEILAERKLIIKIISGYTSKVAALRFFTFMASWEAMLLIFFMEEYIAIFIDNNLQVWCRKSVFGYEPNSPLENTSLLETRKDRDLMCEQQSKEIEDAIGVVYE